MTQNERMNAEEKEEEGERIRNSASALVTANATRRKDENNDVFSSSFLFPLFFSFSSDKEREKKCLKRE